MVLKIIFTVTIVLFIGPLLLTTVRKTPGKIHALMIRGKENSLHANLETVGLGSTWQPIKASLTWNGSGD